MDMGENLEVIRYKKDFDSIVIRCQKMVEQFDGSEETLTYVRRIEESLRNIMSKTN